LKPNKHHVAIICSFLFIGTVWFILSRFTLRNEQFPGPDGALAFLEELTIDKRLQFRGPLPAPVNVIYVDVDSLAISKLGNFPWNREVFAIALDALFKYGGIKAAGMDFVFSKAGNPGIGGENAEKGTKKLGKTIFQNKNVVLAATYNTEAKEEDNSTLFPFVFEKNYGKHPVGPPELPEYPIVGPNWGHVGLINILGNNVRFLPMFAKADNHTYYNLALELALLYWGLDESAIKLEGNFLNVYSEDGSVKATIPLLLSQIAEPNWFHAWEHAYAKHFSIYDVLVNAQILKEGSEDKQVEAAEFFQTFKDSVVLIGPVDPMLKDVLLMPLDGSQPVPGVAVHGNVLKTILSGRFVQRSPVWLNACFIFGLAFLAGSFCLIPAKYSHLARIAGFVSFAGYIAGSFWLLARFDIIIPLVAPVGAAISCTMAGALIQLSLEKDQKRRIQGMFGAYLSPALVEQMIYSGEEPQLGGIDAEITAFFSDVQGFSSFSELLTPQQLVALMNEYLTGMTDILMECSCYVDKYIGDAIVGIFNAPVALDAHALKACVATQRLHKCLAELRKKWASEGAKWPEFVSRMQMRIGLNTGFATVGNMGSDRRFNYTMMGDTVNLAARCESGAKSYGVYTMVTGDTKCAAEKAGDACVFRFLDKIIVKGRKVPAEMFEIVCLKEDLTEEIKTCIATYALGIEHYRAQQWDEALQAFEKSAAIEPNRPEINPDSPSTPSLVMIERVRALKTTPPDPDWNGIFKMQTK
jgi:adenylate cyclase